MPEALPVFSSKISVTAIEFGLSVRLPVALAAGQQRNFVKKV